MMSAWRSWGKKWHKWIVAPAQQSLMWGEELLKHHFAASATCLSDGLTSASIQLDDNSVHNYKLLSTFEYCWSLPHSSVVLLIFIRANLSLFSSLICWHCNKATQETRLFYSSYLCKKSWAFNGVFVCSMSTFIDLFSNDVTHTVNFFMHSKVIFI